MSERGQSTHKQGEQVKIPLLPYKVGKRSRTLVTTVPFPTSYQQPQNIGIQIWASFHIPSNCRTFLRFDRLVGIIIIWFTNFEDNSINITGLGRVV